MGEKRTVSNTEPVDWGQDGFVPRGVDLLAKTPIGLSLQTPRTQHSRTRMPAQRAFWRALVALVLLCFALLPSAPWAQVATHSLYQGRLTDDAGLPRTGPVALRLHLYAAESGGAPLYSEDHAAVALDPQGMFAVALGGGSPIGGGSFDTAVISGVPLYLEVVVEPAVENLTLSPRQRLGALPTARVAGSLSAPASRFEDCGDGTVADHQTGLLWEKKTGTVGATVECDTVAGGCPDPHDVNNLYAWTTDGAGNPNGNAFGDFLARLNGDPTVVAATVAEATGDPADDPTICLAHYCDWRLPVITELTTILVGGGAAPGQSSICGSAPCIDPGFAAVGGPTHSIVRSTRDYFSSSTLADTPFTVWNASFQFGHVQFNGKTFDMFVRAVRAGTCD